VRGQNRRYHHQTLPSHLFFSNLLGPFGFSFEIILYHEDDARQFLGSELGAVRRDDKGPFPRRIPLTQRQRHATGCSRHSEFRIEILDTILRSRLTRQPVRIVALLGLFLITLSFLDSNLRKAERSLKRVE
jgi:hypothetical protein